MHWWMKIDVHSYNPLGLHTALSVFMSEDVCKVDAIT